MGGVWLYGCCISKASSGFQHQHVCGAFLSFSSLSCEAVVELNERYWYEATVHVCLHCR